MEENAVTVENVKIPFHKIKEILEDYFLDFETFELFVLKFVNPIKDICGEIRNNFQLATSYKIIQRVLFRKVCAQMKFP